ncbi:MAG: KTSC domain-containing protein [Candidatus Omnitrophota bacterium]
MSYNKEPVESSNVESVSYDDKTQDLTVTFKRSGSYIYHDVPKSIGNAMPYAESKGKFVWEVLRGKYSYSK